MRDRITIVLVKLMSAILARIGRGGSLPGQIALRFHPQVLQGLHYPDKIIVTSGTNGKTTTNNMLQQVMKQSCKHVICNYRGDNLLAGIATLILKHTTMGLRVNSDCIVLEVDELNVPHVLKNIPVSTILITNFFRDQLDRAGEMERVVAKVGAALANYQGRLVLNGDDPNVVRLADVAPVADVVYFGVEQTAMSKATSKEASEGKFCYRCQQELVYAYYQYSHVGRFHCPNCDFGHHDFYTQAKNVDIAKQSFVVDEVVFHMPQDTLYAVYNCAGVISVAKLYNIPLADVASVLQAFELKDGRMESFDIGRPCLLNLVKNPTGANEVMKYIMRHDGAKDIVIVLNDNVQDGTDVSWIWDAHFDLLVNDGTKHIICSGSRAYDMALRLKYENYQGDLQVLPNMEEAVQQLKTMNNEAHVIATYTALQPMRTTLRRNAR